MLMLLQYFKSVHCDLVCVFYKLQTHNTRVFKKTSLLLILKVKLHITSTKWCEILHNNRNLTFEHIDSIFVINMCFIKGIPKYVDLFMGFLFKILDFRANEFDKQCNYANVELLYRFLQSSSSYKSVLQVNAVLLPTPIGRLTFQSKKQTT